MQKPLLSIVLTTRNRGARLRELLVSLLSQTTEDVEIVVVDGASEDDTATILMEFKDLGLPLRYLTLQENGGMDLDFIRAADLALGGHIWFTGDDDIFIQGSVGKVLEEIKQNNPSLLVVNYEVADVHLSNVIDNNRLQVAESEHRRQAKPDEIFSQFGYAMSYIGSTVVSREVWQTFEAEEFIGSYFIHLGAAFTSSLPRGVSIVGIPAIRIRSGDASWQKNAFVIWNEKWPQLVSKLSALSESYRSHFVREWRRMEFRRLLWLKAIGTATDTDLVNFFDRQPPKTHVEKLTRLLLRTPKRVLASIAKAKLRLDHLLLGKNVTWALHELSEKAE
jgi:abequosyltransferase